MSVPTVSVVIPTHNRAQLIKRAMSSVLSQTHRELEVIVVDDASTDATEQVLASIGDRRLRYIRLESNRGACVARNAGIAASTGEYVAFLDSDDEWLPNKLELQLKALRTTDLSDVGVVLTGHRKLRRDGRESIWVPCKRGWIFDDILTTSYAGWSTIVLLIKRRILDDHQIRFDEKLVARQDFDFCARLAQHCQFEIVSEPLVIIHDHDGERVRTASRALRANLYLHDKFQSELRVRPRTHSRFHFKTALVSAAAKDWSQARRQVLKGIKASPGWPLGYVWLTLYIASTSKLPHGPQRFLMRALDRSTFGRRRQRLSTTAPWEPSSSANAVASSSRIISSHVASERTFAESLSSQRIEDQSNP